MQQWLLRELTNNNIFKLGENPDIVREVNRGYLPFICHSSSSYGRVFMIQVRQEKDGDLRFILLPPQTAVLPLQVT